MVDMSAVVTKANELDNDIAKIRQELKRVQCVKHRLKQIPNKPSFQTELTKVLQEEELLKSVRDYVQGPRKNVNTLTQEMVDIMSMDETMRALKAIQSKKTHTKWLSTEPGDNDEYREACRIENMLKAHRDKIMPKNYGLIHAKEIRAYLEVLKYCDDMDKLDCIYAIEEFIERTCNNCTA